MRLADASPVPGHASGWHGSCWCVPGGSRAAPGGTSLAGGRWHVPCRCKAHARPRAAPGPAPVLPRPAPGPAPPWLPGRPPAAPGGVSRPPSWSWSRSPVPGPRARVPSWRRRPGGGPGPLARPLPGHVAALIHGRLSRALPPGALVAASLAGLAGVAPFVASSPVSPTQQPGWHARCVCGLLGYCPGGTDLAPCSCAGPGRPGGGGRR